MHVEREAETVGTRSLTTKVKWYEQSVLDYNGFHFTMFGGITSVWLWFGLMLYSTWVKVQNFQHPELKKSKSES